ncbi:hypothetical protein FH972_000919 [Carpinus fangiana]|uniref:Uncharacterized protein n=1 Tax=Carpinus fangiana TaxID=176857 RepID=A0A5N6QAB7_9ROSI|nr:hypothetical protein FH972_000919 [Carpinus fangiana]
MATEIQRLQTFPPPFIRLSRNNSSIDDDDEDSHRYTSLKDIILISPPKSCTNEEGNHHHHYFDSSNIAIRNHLVKHAASAYLQSAAILASRNQNQIMRFSEKLRDRTTFCTSTWNVYIANLVTACFRPICHLFAYMHGK